MAGWKTDDLTARLRENPHLGFDPKGTGSLTNSVTALEVVARDIQREHDLQAAAFEEFGKLALLYPAFRLIHPIPNGQYRAGQRPEAGLSFGKGYPDIAWDIPRRREDGRGLYHGLRCELKVGRNQPSAEQVWWAEQLTALGYYVVTIWDDLEKVIRTFQWYYNLGEIL